MIERSYVIFFNNENIYFKKYWNVNTLLFFKYFFNNKY